MPHDSRPIFFSHGNGFPNACYSVLFNHLGDRFNILYGEKLGHHADYPITNNWPHLVDELIQLIRSKSDVPVIGLGHSFGGVLTLLASMKAPDLFDRVIMLDSPILTPMKSFVLRNIKRLGLIDYVTPAHKAKRRKTRWDTVEEARAYLKSKPLFRHFEPQCFDDYIHYGLKETEEGVELVFEQEREYEIFRTLPDHFFSYHKTLTVPTGIIYGRTSGVISRADARQISHNYKVTCLDIEGTHMFPFESPEQTATLIKKLVQEL